MGWLDGDAKHLEWNIKYTRKAMVAQISMLVFNVAGIVWNTWWLLDPSTTSRGTFGFGLGAFLSNLLWTLTFLCKYYDEIRHDREQLRYIKKITSDSNLEQDREDYKKAKDFYEVTYKNIMEEYIRAKPEGSAKLNPELFNVARFPNCS